MPTAAQAMIARIDEARRAGDSLGGVVECVCRNVPPGFGEPVFDKLEADLARAMMSLPASKGFEIGSGFAGTLLTGMQHNDPFTVDAAGRVRTTSNRSGGVQGGISNGEDIIFRVAFKPTATIAQAQQTVDRGGHAVDPRSARPPRPVRAAARRAHRRGHGLPGAGRSLAAPARPVRGVRRWLHPKLTAAAEPRRLVSLRCGNSFSLSLP